MNKPVGVDCCFIREKIEIRDVKLAYTNIDDQIVDFVTKGVTRRQVNAVLFKLGMVNISAPAQGKVLMK